MGYTPREETIGLSLGWCHRTEESAEKAVAVWECVEIRSPKA
jgi:hypothetical protein